MKFDKQKMEQLTALYSTDQLSDEERKQLLAAALEDQELFDALAQEDAVRDALILPGARERVLGDLRPKLSRWFAWAGGLAVAAASAIIFLVVRTQPVAVEAPPLIAENKVEQRIAVKENEAAPIMANRQQPASIGSAPNKQVARKVVSPASLPPPPVPMEIAKEAAPRHEKPDLPERADFGVAASNAPAVVAEVKASNAMPAAKKASAPSAAFTVLRKDGDGIFVPVPSGEILKLGDSVRISVRAPLTGRMIVDSGTSSFQETKAGELYVIPTSGEIVLNKPTRESFVRISFTSSDLAVERRTVSRLRDANAQAAPASAGSFTLPVILEIKLTYK